MKKDKLPLSQAQKLQALLLGEVFTFSQLSKTLVERLVEHRVIYPARPREKLRLLDMNALGLCLAYHYGFEDLDAYVAELLNENQTGMSAIHAGMHSKKTDVKPLTGLYLSSVDGVSMCRDGEDLVVQTPLGSGLFIQEGFISLTFDSAVLLVIVENAENMTHFSRYRKWFDSKRDVLCVYRTGVHSWLESLDNDIVYFGDIDLAGIAIYEKEIVPHIKHNRHTFFIPNDIDERLKNGDNELYTYQALKYRSLESRYSYLNELIAKIHGYQSSIEQQGII